MKNNISQFSLSSIREKREKDNLELLKVTEIENKCEHDYIKGEFMGYDSSLTDDEMFLFTCSKCDDDYVFYDEEYFKDVMNKIN